MQVLAQRSAVLLLAVHLWIGGPTGAVAAAQAVAAASGAMLAPHRAVYDMTLESARAGSGVAGVLGRMVYEFSGSPCEGYTVTMRLVTQITDRAGDATVTDLRSTTWEDGEGQEFRFNSTQYTDERLSETAAGAAERVGSDGRIRVRVTKPAPSEREFGGNVIFPTQHSLAVLAAARDGRTLVQAPIFDGSERGEQVYDTTAFIGGIREPGADEPQNGPERAEKLVEVPSWPIAIGYFDTDDTGDAAPTYELAFHLYANGVSRDLTIDYGDFVIRGSLSALEFFAPTVCR